MTEKYDEESLDWAKRPEMSEDAFRFWDRHFGIVRKERTLIPDTYEVFVELCNTAGTLAEFNRAILKDGSVRKNRNGNSVPHQLIGERDKALQRKMILMAQFRLTPETSMNIPCARAATDEDFLI